MRNSVLYGIFALGVAIGFTPGASRAADRDRENAPEAVRKALGYVYAKDANLDIQEPRRMNGVEVYDVNVRTGNGSTFAQVTADGELIVAGAPANVSDAPSEVREIAEGLFKTGSQADVFTLTSYYV